MQLHPTSRSRRVRRLLAVSAAAVAVMIAPTACNYGGAAQMDMPTHSGHMDGMNMDDPAQPGAPEEHQVVPVANQVPATAAPDGRRRRPRPPPTRRGRATTGAAATDRRAAGATSRRRADDPDRRPATTDRPPRPPPRPTDAAAATAPPAPRPSAPAAPAERRQQQRPRGPRPRLHEASETARRTTASRTRRACVSTADGRDRRRGQAALAADHRRAAAGRRQPAVQARGQHPQPGARPVPRRRRGRLLPGELVPQRRTACSAGTSTPPAGSSRRPSRRPTRAVAPAFFLATQDNGGGAAPDTVTIDVPATAIKTAGDAAVHLVGR